MMEEKQQIRKNSERRRDRRRGFPRRSYTYAYCIPERRNGQDRRNNEDSTDAQLPDQNLQPSDDEPCAQDPPAGKDGTQAPDD
jgi:hypothetical protein